MLIQQSRGDIMPELPEVETVKETLKRQILNKNIKNINIYWDNIIAYPAKDLFITNIKNQMIKDINRKGKWLIFELSDYYLLCHLRMEGKFFIKDGSAERVKHEHIIFQLDDVDLRYHDTRKFGKMHLLKKEELMIRGPLTKVGLEPFDEDLTPAYLKAKYKNKKIPIKTALLDQSIITGIGNIYADEILFRAKINPLKKANTLTNKELERIIDNTKKVLIEAITMGGTTIKSYTSSLGVTGRFQQELMVHNQKGKPCKTCGSVIEKIVVNGRGTYYCLSVKKT